MAVMGAVWARWPEPAGDQVWAYQKPQPGDYRLLRGDALGFVAAKANEGFDLHTRYSEATSFEIRCKGVRVMTVENFHTRVLIRMPADALWRAPDIGRLYLSFQRWLDYEQGHGQARVEPEEPSWLEARLRRVVERVPRGQRCVLGE